MNEPESWSLPVLRALSILGLIVLVAVVYYPGLSGSFIFDDTSNIVENPAIQMHSLGPEDLADAATAYGDRLPHRPISTITLAFDHWLWGGDPFGFKLTNLILHLIATVLVFLLARQLFWRAGDLAGPKVPFWAALAVAALWAIHPLQISTVLYVVQRMEMLAAMFIILSLLVYIGGRTRLECGTSGGWLLIALSGLCALLALLSKETGALAPFLMLALEFFVFRFAAASARSERALKLGFAAIVVVALSVYLFWLVPEFVYGEHFVKREFTWSERVLTQLRVLPMYIGWILYPSTDNYLFYYDHFAHSEGLLSPITTLLGALFLLALVVAAWLLNRRAPLIALGIVWFFVAHALTSNLFSLELVFEHRNYFAVFAVLLAVVAGFAKLPVLRHPPLSAAVVCAVLVIGLGLLTAIRAATWGAPMNLALHHVEVNPQSERAGLDLAELYIGNGGWDPAGSPFLRSALRQLERVAELPNARTTADQALIVIAAQRDQDAPKGAWERLLIKARNRSFNTSDYDAIYNLVQQRYRGLSIDDERLWQLHQVLCEREDIPADIHVRFGYYFELRLDDSIRSTSAFRRAIELLSEESTERQGKLKDALRRENVVLREGVEACADVGGAQLEGMQL